MLNHDIKLLSSRSAYYQISVPNADRVRYLVVCDARLSPALVRGHDSCCRPMRALGNKDKTRRLLRTSSSDEYGLVSTEGCILLLEFLYRVAPSQAPLGTFLNPSICGFYPWYSTSSIHILITSSRQPEWISVRRASSLISSGFRTLIFDGAADSILSLLPRRPAALPAASCSRVWLGRQWSTKAIQSIPPQWKIR